MSLTAFQWPTNINEVGPRCKLMLFTRLILNSVTTSCAEDREGLTSCMDHDSWCAERDGTKKSTVKFVKKSTSQSWSWRWQVLQVQCAMRPLLSCEREANNHWNEGFLGSPPNSCCRIWPHPSMRVGQSRDICRLQQVEGELTLPKLCSYASVKMARFFSVAASRPSIRKKRFRNLHPLKPMPGASAYAERAEVSKIIKSTSWHELLPKSWRKLGASFQIMGYAAAILDFSWEKLVASESHLAVQQPSELKLVEVSKVEASSITPSSCTGLNHPAAKHPRRGQGVAGIKQRVLMAKSRTFWFCISLNQALRAGDIHQVHHGVLSKVVSHRLDSFYWLLQLATMFCPSFWMEEVAKTLWSFDETSAKNQVPTAKVLYSGKHDILTSTKSCGSTKEGTNSGGARIFGWFFWRGWMCDYEQ